MGKIDWTYRHLQLAGATEMGKTAAAQALLRDRGIRRRIVFDPQHDYVERENVQVVVSELDQVRGYLEDVHPGDDFSIALQPTSDDDAGQAEALAVIAWEHGDCVLVVEEAEEALSAAARPLEVRRLAKKGRHRNIGVWPSSQRPGDVAPGVRSQLQAHEAFFFRLAGNTDLDMLAGLRGREFADRVADLPQLHALRVVPGSREPELWHVSFATTPHTFGPCDCGAGA